MGVGIKGVVCSDNCACWTLGLDSPQAGQSKHHFVNNWKYRKERCKKKTGFTKVSPLPPKKRKKKKERRRGVKTREAVLIRVFLLHV